MRKLILNLFALNFRFKFGKVKYNQLRVATFTYPFVLSQIYLMYKHYDNIFVIANAVILAILLFFGFIYFRFYPIGKYKDDILYLDNSQANQYLVKEKFQSDNGYCDSKFWFWLNPILIVIFIILMFL